MAKPRAPRHPERYVPAENAAKGLEDLAADLRRQAIHGQLVKWDINIGFWTPDDVPPRREPTEGGNV